jgi:hypothetical protein
MFAEFAKFAKFANFKPFARRGRGAPCGSFPGCITGAPASPRALSRRSVRCEAKIPGL